MQDVKLIDLYRPFKTYIVSLMSKKYLACIQSEYHEQDTGLGTKIVLLLVSNIVIRSCCFDFVFSRGSRVSTL